MRCSSSCSGRPGLEPELGAQPGCAAPVRVECVCLPPRPVEREHQLLEQMLPERMRGDESVQLRHKLALAAEREVCRR